MRRKGPVLLGAVFESFVPFIFFADLDFGIFRIILMFLKNQPQNR